LKASQAAIPLIKECIAEVPKERWACSAGLLRRDVFGLFERLEHDVPPCEVEEVGKLVGRQTRLAAIINAGWLYQLAQRPRTPPQSLAEAVQRRDRARQINGLTLKAIELSEIRRQLGVTEAIRGS